MLFYEKYFIVAINLSVRQKAYRFKHEILAAAYGSKSICYQGTSFEWNFPCALFLRDSFSR